MSSSSSGQKKRQKKSNKQRDNEKMIKCLQRRLAWCNHSGQKFNPGNEQYSTFPRALSDENGVPHKAPKSMDCQERYQKTKHNVFSNDVSTWLQPLCSVIVDAMFVINTKPLRSTKTLSDYVTLLFSRFVKEHFSFGAAEVHLIFDRPSTEDTGFNPKKVEQLRRDSSSGKVHEHHKIDMETTLPLTQWQDVISCRICKYSLVKALGNCLLKDGRFLVKEGQTLIIPGCFDNGIAWKVKHGTITVPQPEPLYYSNAIEADQRIWRHVTSCDAENILVYSPDTDVFTIGMSNLTVHSKQIIVQLNPPSSRIKRYVNLNNLLEALNDDPDLSAIPHAERPLVLMSLFVATGSDFTSYFRSIGKATFLKHFFQDASFITGSAMQSSLANFNLQMREFGFLAFLRLVGTAYFKKHLASVISHYNLETPTQLYNSISTSLSPYNRHKE